LQTVRIEITEERLRPHSSDDDTLASKYRASVSFEMHPFKPQMRGDFSSRNVNVFRVFSRTRPARVVKGNTICRSSEGLRGPMALRDKYLQNPNPGDLP
jgi:hypothetical protein